MDIREAVNRAALGNDLAKEELLSLLHADTEALLRGADEVRRSRCGTQFELCTIINGRSGRCSEDCRYCAQSSHYHTEIAEYDLLPESVILQSARSNERAGVHRFSIVTSGRAMGGNQMDELCHIYESLSKNCRMGLCASHGLLSYEELLRLKQSGVTRYHNNLETSRRFFPSVCTTHSYDDKIRTIQAAKRAGLTVCSGGIIGLGETMEDRLDMALTLRELEVDSVPLNVLNPIPGTPMEHMELLSYEEICVTAALFRFALPALQIRLAGGRSLMPDKGRRAMESGINAAISGDMLTTSGIKTEEDLAMVEEIGYLVDKYEGTGSNGGCKEAGRE